MNIQLNGKLKNIDPHLTAAQLLASLDLTGQRIAMEVNQEIVPRSQHDTHLFNENDKVEIVRAIGGG
ncbi:MAG: sulfur carrier protein ThiS [Gammaproteobacteria bacterium]|nr:sulfur carrier protein ThiS [Gammaproteobacteria bacterium]